MAEDKKAIWIFADGSRLDRATNFAIQQIIYDCITNDSPKPCHAYELAAALGIRRERLARICEALGMDYQVKRALKANRKAK